MAQELVSLVAEDVRAYGQVSAAYGIPRDEPARARQAPRQTRGRSCPSSLGSYARTFKSYTSVDWQPPTDCIDHIMVLSLAHKYSSVSAPGHRGFLWHTIDHANANMGHMAHLSGLPDVTNWDISINKEPVGATPTHARPIKTTGTSPRGEPAAPALPSFTPGHIAT